MPSGAFTKLTGRNQLSDERTNSVFAVDARRLERRAVGRERHAVDQVVLRVADEGIAAKVLGVGGAAVDRHPGGRVDDMVAGARGFGRALAVRDPAARPDLPPALERADPDGSAPGCPPRSRSPAARAGTGSAPGFRAAARRGATAATRCTGSGCRSRRTSLPNWIVPVTVSNARVTGSKRKSRAVDVDRLGLRVIGAANLAAVDRRRAVDLVVEPERQVVDASLLVLGAEPGEDLAAHVGDVVAVRVLEVPDVRRRGDEDASLPGATPVGHMSLSAKTSLWSNRPSPSVSRSRRTAPSGSLPGWGLYG